MADWSELGRLPPDVITQRSARAVFAARRDLVAGLDAAGYRAGPAAVLPASDLAGRVPLLELSMGAERFVVRRFTHGGVLRWLTGRRYWDPLRPFRELRLARRLNDLGVRVPEVVAASARRCRAFGWELDLVSRRIEDTLDLGTLLSRTARGLLAPSVERCCTRALGRLVARLHQLEFLHADLTPRNVLVDADSLHSAEPCLWLLDLDGSRFVPELSAAQRNANLSRLLRHAARMQREGLVARAPRLYAAFLGAYEPRRAERHALWAALAVEQQRARAWHAAGSALERAVGGTRSQPRP